MTNSSAGTSTSPIRTGTVVTRVVAMLSGLSNRRNSSTALERPDGSARKDASWAGFRSNARIPFPMKFTVVSYPAKMSR